MPPTTIKTVRVHPSTRLASVLPLQLKLLSHLTTLLSTFQTNNHASDLDREPRLEPIIFGDPSILSRRPTASINWTRVLLRPSFGCGGQCYLEVLYNIVSIQNDLTRSSPWRNHKAKEAYCPAHHNKSYLWGGRGTGGRREQWIRIDWLDRLIREIRREREHYELVQKVNILRLTWMK